MDIINVDNYNLMSARAADIVIDLIAQNSSCVLALPTGNTPIGLYQELVEECKQGELSFKDVISFNLDDYVGVPKDHLASFYTYMRKYLFDHVDFKPENIYMLDGMSNDLDFICDDYERSIKEHGGLDLAILGIGTEGHIAYNEVGTDFDSKTHVVTLKESSKKNVPIDFANKKEIPSKGITMGIATIMSAKKILLLANGKDKAKAIKKALYGPITQDVPASILQKHDNLTVILDNDAAGK